jgi:hypothetical protein
MKYLKMAFGLALVAGLMSVVASPAMAVPRWVHCVKSETGKYSNGLCNAAGSGWETKELVGTSEVTSSGELELEDTNATLGAVAVKCKGENIGWVANLATGAGEDGVTSITNLSCTRVVDGQCTKLVRVVPRNLPWGSRLVEKGTEVRDELISGPKKEEGNGEPGWAVTCETPLGEVTDTCERSGSTQNVRANRTTGKTEFIFDKITEEKKERAKCSVGGAETGRVTGTILGQLRSGNALWVLAPNLGT